MTIADLKPFMVLERDELDWDTDEPTPVRYRVEYDRGRWMLRRAPFAVGERRPVANLDEFRIVSTYSDGTTDHVTRAFDVLADALAAPKEER